MTDEQNPAKGSRMKARQKAYINWLIIVPSIIGFAIGVLLTSSGGGKRGFIDALAEGTATLDLTTGLIVSSIIAIGIPFTFYKWHTSIDEQEEHAVLWGNTLMLYFGTTLWLAWWVLAATKLVPPVNLEIVLLASAFLSIAYWAWKKFL